MFPHPVTLASSVGVTSALPPAPPAPVARRRPAGARAGRSRGRSCPAPVDPAEAPAAPAPPPVPAVPVWELLLLQAPARPAAKKTAPIESLPWVIASPVEVRPRRAAVAAPDMTTV